VYPALSFCKSIASCKALSRTGLFQCRSLNPRWLSLGRRRFVIVFPVAVFVLLAVGRPQPQSYFLSKLVLCPINDVALSALSFPPPLQMFECLCAWAYWPGWVITLVSAAVVVSISVDPA